MKRSVSRIAAVLLLCCAVMLCFAGLAAAEDRKLEIRPASTIAEVLGGLAGASVDLTLNSGTTLSGKVGSVQQHVMVLAELRGKEFYDAVVKIEDISAVSVRVRSK